MGRWPLRWAAGPYSESSSRHGPLALTSGLPPDFGRWPFSTDPLDRFQRESARRVTRRQAVLMQHRLCEAKKLPSR